jgi:hypothetical protein
MLGADGSSRSVARNAFLTLWSAPTIKRDSASAVSAWTPGLVSDFSLAAPSSRDRPDSHHLASTSSSQAAVVQCCSGCGLRRPRRLRAGFGPCFDLGLGVEACSLLSETHHVLLDVLRPLANALAELPAPSLPAAPAAVPSAVARSLEYGSVRRRVAGDSASEKQATHVALGLSYGYHFAP